MTLMGQARLVVLAISVLLVAALIPMAASAQKGPKPPKNPAPGNNQLTIAASPNPVTYGSATAVSGQLKGSGNGGKTITLEARAYPFTGAYRTVSTTTSASNGSYRFAPRPRAATRYRTTAATNPRETSSDVLVSVRLRVGLVASDRTPRRGQTVRFVGSAYPAHDGARVYIQRRSLTGRFFTVVRTSLRDAGTARSRYSRRLRIRRSGVYRIKTAADADHVGGTSRSIRLRVH